MKVLEILIDLFPAIFLLGLLSALNRFLNLKLPHHPWINLIKSPGVIYLLLLCWTIFGFLGNLDYTLAWGCIIDEEPIFSAPNLMFSGMAVVLVSFGTFTSSRTLAALALIGELCFWLYKLFMVKGGYAVGFGGVPDSSVLAFDTIALLLRMVLIKKILHLPLEAKHLFVLVLGIMTLKVVFFQ